MDRISVLEKEIADLRKALHDKETELYQIKNDWVMNPQNRLMQDQHYGATNSIQYSGNMSKWAIERYSRQILLPDIGVSGQEKLCAAKVLVVGAGGLGCPASVYLAGAGVGEIGIVDYDTVDVTNIHRQILHYERDENVSKAESAAQTLRSINSRIKVIPYSIQLDSSNAMQIASKYDIILDCTDNVPTRYLLNDLSVLLKVPLISGSALQLEGQLTIYGYRASKNTKELESTYIGPCYRCVFPTPPPPEAVGSCSTNGVAGPIPGVIGTLQALEAIKYIVGQTHSRLLVERMLLFDGDDTTFRTVKLRPRNSQCAACSDTPTICQLLDYEVVCKTQAKEKKKEETRLKSERRKQEMDKRMTGQSYYGFRVKPDGSKKWVQDVPKSERKLGPRCTSDICAKGTSRKCIMIKDYDRIEIFRHFWNDLDWREKKAYVRSLVDSVPAKRRRLKIKGNVSRKGASKVYHLEGREGRVPVCRVMFLSTLGVKEAMVRSWLTSQDKPKAPKKALKALNVTSFIDCLPKITPNCKNCAKFEYVALESIHNLHQLYSLYVRESAVQGSMPASRKTFSKVVVSRNVRFNGCQCKDGWESMNLDYQDLDLHILPPENRITAIELAETLHSEQRHLLVDVRSEPEFQMCRIDDATCVPIEKIDVRLQELVETIKDYERVTFICRRGNDSQIAAKKVLDVINPECSGKIKDLTGGLHAWAKLVDKEFPIY